MKRWLARIIFVVISYLMGWGGGLPARADEMPVVSIVNNPDFADVRVQLQAMVNIFGFHKVNHFCIITYSGPKGDNVLIPFVYWPTQNKFIEWGVGSNLIFASTDYFDLTRDVLPDGPDTSVNYLTRSDVDGPIKDCQARGEKFTILKTSSNWVSIKKFGQFSSVQEQLQDVVNNDGSHKQNRFCIIGQKDALFLGAYVIWLTDKKIIFWLPSLNDQYGTNALTDSTLEIDIREGLKDRESSKDDRDEMQKSYAESVLQACSQMGQYFDVRKTNLK